MSSPFIGEIRMGGWNFAPNGWASCNGALVPISENDALFNLIGTTYGGDGQTTFALPNLQSRVPMHVGPGFALGQMGGVETVTLTTSQIPAHGHSPSANSGAGNSDNTSGEVWAFSTAQSYAAVTNNLPPPLTAMGAQAMQASGGSQPHDNMLPFLCVNFIISLFGIFPSQT